MGTEITREEVAEALRQADLLADRLRAILARISTPSVDVPAVPSLSRPIAWAGYLRKLDGQPRVGGKWTVDRANVFIDRVKWICEDLDIGPKPGQPEPSWLMTWMCFESARTFRSDIKNPNSTGMGLIQFMKDTAENDLKIAYASLAKMTPEDQLNEVWKYMRNRIRERGPIRRASDGYLAILMPAYMDDDDSAVIWTPKDRAFAVNAGLDTNKDNRIIKAEVAGIIYKMLAEGLQPENVG